MYGVTSRSPHVNAENLLEFRFKSKSLPLDSSGFTVDNLIYSRFYKLSEMKHPNLAKYVSISKSSFNEINLLIECSGFKLRHYTEGSLHFLDIAFQLLCALEYLHQHGIIAGSISRDSIYLSIPVRFIKQDNTAKLINFGLYFMTGYGRLVDFPPVPIHYAAPEMAAGISTPAVLDINSLIFGHLEFCLESLLLTFIKGIRG